MKFYLYMKSGCEYPDLEDECVAKDRETAIKIFRNRHHIGWINKYDVACEADFKEVPCLQI
jgi:hypothetical protein